MLSTHIPGAAVVLSARVSPSVEACIASYHRDWGWPGPSRPSSHSPAQEISLPGHIHTYIHTYMHTLHTMHTTITESSTVHMSVLTCGHLCIRTHLRTYILSVTSSYPILHTHHTRKLRFKFPASRGRGLIPEVLHGDGREIIPVAHSSGVGSCEMDRDDAAKALPRLSHKARRPLTAHKLLQFQSYATP